MKLLQQIQMETASENTSIATVLRKCIILAGRLDSSELAKWANLELNGYGDMDEIPEYRVLFSVENQGDFIGFNQYATNLAVPAIATSDDIREYLNKPIKLNDGIASYEDMLRGEDRCFYMQRPADFLAYFNSSERKFMPDFQCYRMCWILPRAKLIGITESVRNRILNFSIAIEKENPDAGESVDEVPIPANIVHYIYNQTINGSVGNASQGGQNYSQVSDTASNKET